MSERGRQRGVPHGGARYAIFLTVILLSAVSPALPHQIDPDISWWLGAWGCIAAMIVTGYFATKLPPRNVLATVAPLLLFPAIWCLRCADGNSASGFSPLIFLPVVWFALYGRLRDVVLAVAGGVAATFGPMIFVGSPQYPSLSWRGILLLNLITATLGLLIYRLIDTSWRTNRALSISEKEFRAAFEDAPVGMAITGLHGGEAYRFLRVNRALCAMLGRSAAELTAVPVAELTHPDDVDLTNYSFENATHPDSPRRLEKRYLHKSGRTVWAAVTYSVVNDEYGEPSHLVCQIEDLSARRETDRALLNAVENDLAASERMQQLERIKTELASTISHELRTPLTSAAGYVELLVEGDAGPLTGEQRMMLDTVSRSLARLDGIVGDVLSMARGDMTTPVPPDSVTDLSEVLQAAVTSVALEAARQGQDLVIDDDLGGARVSADPGRIERALVNLLTNAVKFTGDDGKITVTARRNGQTATIAVSDNGIGISDEDKRRIFEQFYRAPTGATAKTPGTGLGLAIVQAITTQYGGTITVDSELGHGSTFTLELPLRQ